MTEMIRRIEAVERSVAELVQLQIMLMGRMVMCADDEHARSGRRADQVIDDARTA